MLLKILQLLIYEDIHTSVAYCGVNVSAMCRLIKPTYRDPDNRFQCALDFKGTVL